MGILRWSLFFLISVGRGTRPPGDHARPSPRSSSTGSTSSRRRRRFQIKTTEATHYRRVAIRADGGRGDDRRRDRRGRRSAAASASATATGSCSSTTTAPSSRPGFLPVAVGQRPRRTTSWTLYRDHPTFTRAARRDAVQGPLRALPVRRALRRLAGARLRLDRRRPRDRPALPVRPAGELSRRGRERGRGERWQRRSSSAAGSPASAAAYELDPGRRARRCSSRRRTGSAARSGRSASTASSWRPGRTRSSPTGRRRSSSRRELGLGDAIIRHHGPAPGPHPGARRDRSRCPRGWASSCRRGWRPS